MERSTYNPHSGYIILGNVKLTETTCIGRQMKVHQKMAQILENSDNCEIKYVIKYMYCGNMDK
jgi:hypothetical protein